MTHFFSRIFSILLGHALAAISSGFVVAICLKLLGGLPGNPPTVSWIQLPATALVIGLLIGFYSAPPAALVVLIGEKLAIRKRRYYAIAGIVIGLGLGLIFWMQNWFPYVGGGYGSVAGLIYWWVAGRRAGFASGEEGAPHRAAQMCVFAVVALAGLITLYAILSPTLLGLFR